MIKREKSVGIDDMALYVPHQFLPIRILAEKRGIEFQKLKFGLGLENMAFPAPDEDAATMAAEAVLELMQKNNLKATEIGRLYIGTESALDGAKPTATYVVQLLEEALKTTRGFQHCDVLDMTFACIGAVDAMQNAMDWVRCNPSQLAIVVATDFAKYELDSSGEYTQGAGAVALLVKGNPRLLAFENRWGIGMESVHDFFKPRRIFSKKDSQQAADSWPFDSDNVHIFKETPVFDGQYSNACYTSRVLEASAHFIRQLSEADQKKDLFKRWVFMAFHLPYAAHARRIGADLFALELERVGSLSDFCAKNGIEKIEIDADKATKANFMKALSKSKGYQAFVQAKLALAQEISGEVGNMYTGSIFLALMATLEGALAQNKSYAKKKIGFFAYGSGSKAKVFEGKLMENWKMVAATFGIKTKLAQRKSIDFETYETWHKEEVAYLHQKTDTQRHFFLSKISDGTDSALEGTRFYTVI